MGVYGNGLRQGILPSAAIGALSGSGQLAAKGVAGMGTDAAMNLLQRMAYGPGLQTLGLAAEAAPTAVAIGTWATGFGEAKLTYDFASFAGAVAACKLGL